MAIFYSLVFWLPVIFGVMVAASYVGTTLALRSYFDDEAYALSAIIDIQDGDRDDG